MSNAPLVSIIIVNFNGKHYLKTCLDAVLDQSFAKNKYEVLVVDNDSDDNSVSYLKNEYPQVRLIVSGQNLGFAGGNNLGVKHTRGEYIALLNNDTKVDKDWLKYLVKAIENDSKLAAVNSKSLLFYPFVTVTIDSETHLRSDFTQSLDFKPVGVAIEEVVTKHPGLQRMIQYYRGFYKKENDDKDQIPLRWTDGSGELLLAVDPNSEAVTYTITLRAQRSKSALKTKVSIKVGKMVLSQETLTGHDVKQIKISLDPKKLKKILQYEVQNAGNVVFKSGYSRDRGAVVGNKQQYFELDNPYFNQSKYVDALCGVSVILRKKLFTKLGGFDKSFFMYYEDVDLSLKLRRLGYKLGYAPQSILYHIHAGSSGEWSPFFIYHVEKNHLAFTAKHFPLRTTVSEIIRYYGLIAITILKVIKWRFSEHWQIFEDKKELLEVRINALNWFWKQLPKIISFRNEMKAQEKVSLQQLYESYY